MTERILTEGSALGAGVAATVGAEQAVGVHSAGRDERDSAAPSG